MKKIDLGLKASSDPEQIKDRYNISQMFLNSIPLKMILLGMD